MANLMTYIHTYKMCLCGRTQTRPNNNIWDNKEIKSSNMHAHLSTHHDLYWKMTLGCMFVCMYVGDWPMPHMPWSYVCELDPHLHHGVVIWTCCLICMTCLKHDVFCVGCLEPCILPTCKLRAHVCVIPTLFVLLTRPNICVHCLRHVCSRCKHGIHMVVVLGNSASLLLHTHLVADTHIWKLLVWRYYYQAC